MPVENVTFPTTAPAAPVLPQRPQAPRSEPPASRRAPADRSGLQAGVEEANRAAGRRSIDLRFGIHEASGEFYVQVLDPKTNEVIKTLPPEGLLDLRGRIEQALGILFDREA